MMIDYQRTIDGHCQELLRKGLRIMLFEREVS